MTKLQRFNALIGQEGATFQNTLKRAKRLQQLAPFLDQCLGPAITQHCRLANLRGDTLILQSDSPSWSAKLRYLAPQLLDCLQQHPQLAGIKRITVRVAPRSQSAKRPARRLQLSSHNARIIEQLAESLKDSTLGEALKRLAARRR